MSKRIILTGPVVKVLAVVAVVLGFGLMLYLMAGMPSPRESDRLATFDGSMSMIPPRGKDWTSAVVYGPSNVNFISQITIVHSGMQTGVPDSLRVSRFRNPVNIKEMEELGFAPSIFQDGPAWVLKKKGKRDFTWRAVFDRQGQWYDITLILQKEEDVPNSGWWPFITSFQAKPSTQPTTVPAATMPLIPPPTTNAMPMVQ